MESFRFLRTYFQFRNAQQ